MIIGNSNYRVLMSLVLLWAPAIVDAKQQFDVRMTTTGSAVALVQEPPAYPEDNVKRGQEGWVRMSYVVTPQGLAVDPIILDSSGGASFEAQARKIIAQWRFEPVAAELPYNVVNIWSEVRNGRDSASRGFIRQMNHVLDYHNDQRFDAASIQVDALAKRGGLNLYESTMMWLLTGRINAANDDAAGNLEKYGRALALGNTKALPSVDRIGLLENIFSLQAELQQFSAALKTRARLQKLKASAGALTRTAPLANQIKDALESPISTAAKATILNPCDCDEGEPLWHYVATKSNFSFANISGDVERFEARCAGHRIAATVSPDKVWPIDPEWGYCRVFVFGESGATFDFIEHTSDNSMGVDAEENDAKPIDTSVSNPE